MWQRREGSADQLGGMRSTCPVRAGSPLTAVCQPEKEGMREGREEDREKDKEGLREQKINKEDAKKREEEERQSNERYPQH